MKVVEIGLNAQFIGEIEDTKADERILAENGLPAIWKVKPFIYGTAAQGYYELGECPGKACSVERKK